MLTPDGAMTCAWGGRGFVARTLPSRLTSALRHTQLCGARGGEAGQPPGPVISFPASRNPEFSSLGVARPPGDPRPNWPPGDCVSIWPRSTRRRVINLEMSSLVGLQRLHTPHRLKVAGVDATSQGGISSTQYGGHSRGDPSILRPGRVLGP